MMSYGRCWSCGSRMTGDSQTIQSLVTCDRCGWVSSKKGD